MTPNLATRIATIAVRGLLLAGLAIPAHVHAQGNDNGRGRHKQLYAVPADRFPWTTTSLPTASG